jgi:hypothetical protein
MCQYKKGTHMQGEGVKDYLRDIGRDVASSLGEELKGIAKDKATSFVM